MGDAGGRVTDSHRRSDGPGGGVVFDFRLGRGRDGPKKFLGQSREGSSSRRRSSTPPMRRPRASWG
jgi:hypothetical protein